MEYGCVYAQRTVSHVTPNEARYIDRIFMKALVRTSFGSQMKKEGVLVNDDVQRMDGARDLYKHTGYYFFSDNEFSFRNFSDTSEWDMSFRKLSRARLLVETLAITKRFSSSLEKALEDVEEGTYSGPFKEGARATYREVKRLLSG